jgi:ribokinase
MACRTAMTSCIKLMFIVKDIVRPGETVSSVSLSRRAGGKGANQAAAVAKAGGIVTLVGAIGQDGVWVKDQLENFGVEVDAITTVDVSCTVRKLDRNLW